MSLCPETPEKTRDRALGYMEFLAATYLLSPKPDTTYHDWPDIATKGLHDLINNKGCWAQSKGHPYLNAYVCDYDTPPEIMVQLAVLVPLTEYFEWKGKTNAILRENPDVISDDVKTGEIDQKLWIPLEDLRDGWEKSEQVGQEVYGAAGAGFGILPRQYFRLPDTDLLLYCDYPVCQFRKYKTGKVTFEIGGDTRLLSHIRILGSLKNIRFRLVQNRYAVSETPSDKGKNWTEYTLSGHCQVMLSWTKTTKKQKKLIFRDCCHLILTGFHRY